jgi:hypothetical protein
MQQARRGREVNKPVKTKDVKASKVTSAELKAFTEKVIADMQARWNAENQESAEFSRYLLKLNQKAQAAYMMIEAAAMDTMLGDLLKTKMPKLNKKLKDKLFNGNGGAFNTFASKIDCAYVMGIIGASTHKDMEIFRLIRNQFAHTQVRLHFESDKLAVLLEKFEGYVNGADKQNFMEAKSTEIRAALKAALDSLTASSEGNMESEIGSKSTMEKPKTA